MGTLPTSHFYYDDSEINTELIKENNSKLYTYNVSIKYSNINNINKNDDYKLHLCENDIILENNTKQHSFIYQKIDSWFCSDNTFGFLYNDNKNNINNYQKIILYVSNSKDIIDNLNKITTDLVIYYKTLS